MKQLETDETLYIFPTAHPHNSLSVYSNVGEFIFWLTNLFDIYPTNPCKLINGSSSIIEVRTENSEAIGITGANVENIEVQIYNGTVHDVNDIVLNGDLSSWPSGYSSPPENWTCESNCNYSGSGSSLNVGDYPYPSYIYLIPSATSGNNAFKQTRPVTANTVYKLSALYQKDHTSDVQYFIYDESNGQYICENIRFPNPKNDTKTFTTGWLHVIFETPANCTSITFGFQIEGITGSGNTIRLYGISIRERSQTYDPVNIKDTGIYDGKQFNRFLQEYTKITEKHSAVLIVDTSAEEIEIGNITTGSFTNWPDPLAGMNQGLKKGATVTELPYQGPLIDKKYNPDIYNISLNLFEENADAFMFDLIPRIRRKPMWYVIGNLSGQEWTGYFKYMGGLPTRHDTIGVKKRISFNVKEAL